jgi:hypothetical protein
MLGGETDRQAGKITFGRIKYKLRNSSKKFPSWYKILIEWEGTEFRTL